MISLLAKGGKTGNLLFSTYISKPNERQRAKGRESKGRGITCATTTMGSTVVPPPAGDYVGTSCWR